MNNGTINAKDLAPSYNVLTFCEFFVTFVLYSVSLLLLLRILWGVRRKSKKTASKKASLSTANVTPSLLLYFIAWTVDIIVSIPFLVYYIVTWRANTPLRDGATWVWLAIWTFPLQAFVAVSVSTLTLERISCIIWPGHRSPRQRWILTFFGITIGAIVACGSFAHLLIYELPIPPIIDCAGYAGCFRSPSTNFYNFSRQIISVINAILGICFFVLLQRRWNLYIKNKQMYIEDLSPLSSLSFRHFLIQRVPGADYCHLDSLKDVSPSYNVLTFCEYFVTLILYSISLLLLLRILWTVWRKGKTASKKASLSRANVTPSLLLYFIAWTVDIIVSIPFVVYYIVTWRANTPLRDGATWVWLAIWTFPLQAFVAVSVSTLTLERISCIIWPGHRSPRQRWILTFFGITIGAIVACGSFAHLLIYELPIPPIIDCAGYAGCFRSPSTNFYNFSRQIISVINAILGICFFVLLQRRWNSSVASKGGNHHFLNITAGIVLVAEFMFNILPVCIVQSGLAFFFGIAIAAHTGPIFPTVLPAMDVFVASIIYTAWLGKRLFRK